MAQIPNFWPLVVEQAPPDLDDYIQPSDSALLLSSLTALSVERFEAAAGADGDPRSVAIRFDFAPNDVFADASLTKRFWWRRAADGWAGLVSEPVDIRWKPGRDLTYGMLGLVKKIWDASPGAQADGGGGSAARALAADRAALRKKIKNTGMGGVSFFAWFGYVGRRVGADESRAATAAERERRRLRREGREVPEPGPEPPVQDEDDDESLEIFEGGDELALFIADDLWPNAIKYFSEYSPLAVGIGRFGPPLTSSPSSPGAGAGCHERRRLRYGRRR